MQLIARVKHNPQFRKYPVHAIKHLPGAKVCLFPETVKNTAIGPSVDILPLDLRFKTPQQILVKHLKMDERTEKVLEREIDKLPPIAVKQS